MAGVYKIGHAQATPHEQAIEATVSRIRALGDQDPILEGPSIVQTAAHEAAGEYLVEVVTGTPPPRQRLGVVRR